MLQEQENNKEEHEIDLRHYVKIVFRRKWIIIVSFIIALIFAAFNAFKATPVYLVTAKVVIDKENPNVLSFDEVLAMDSTGNQFYQTQYKVLSSRSLAWRVIESLNLKNSPEFRSDKKSKKESQLSDRKRSALINRYLGKLKIQPVRDSSIVNISFEGFHPALITKIVNKHAGEYISSNLDARFSASREAVEWLKNQISIKRALVEKAENTLQIYKEKRGIISLEGRQDIIVEKIADLESDLTEIGRERIKLETKCNMARENAKNHEVLETIPEVIENGLIQSLKDEYAGLSTKTKRLSTRYGRNHPVMIRASTEVEDVKNRIELEVSKVIMSIELENKMALAEEAKIETALEEQKELAMKLNRDAIAYGTLKRESDSERVMYNLNLAPNVPLPYERQNIIKINH